MPALRSLVLALATLAGVGAVSLGIAWQRASPAMGALATGARRDRMAASPQWRDGAFANRLPQVDGGVTRVLAKQFRATEGPQEPTGALPVQARSAADYAQPPASGLRVTWLGHSTLLVEQDGARLLIDPVWGERASPFPNAGPARWFPPPLPLDALPAVDAVLISHDHYDHLDWPTVVALADRPIQWVVPLGIGAHLEHWGIDPARITELDWWEETTVAGVTLTSTPARHFSGRWLDRFRSTLWTGWALRGPDHAVWYSGDTALFPELDDIGQRLGPFDLTLVEAGAYDATWTDVHLGPEQAVIAHQMVRGRVMMPVHWGLFDLGNHAWTEPMERVWTAAARQGVPLKSPPPGGMFELDGAPPTRWWPAEPFVPLADDPVWSTSVDGVLDRWWGPR